MDVRGQVTRCVLAVLVSISVASCSSSGNARDGAVEPRLPTVVNAPGTWSDEVGPDGPVAAVGVATRTLPQGVLGETSSLELFAVSAEDGRGSWLLPDAGYTQRADPPWSFTVSPDGRWVAWTADVGVPANMATRSAGWVHGWRLMDTTTGQVRELGDAEVDRVDVTVGQLEFSGDSRYLVATYARPSKPGSWRSADYQLAAWDVESGASTVLAAPGTRPGPIGSAPSGVVWAQDNEVVRTDPATGERSSITLPQSVGVASWGPGGSFAYAALGSTASVHVGRTVEEAIDTEVSLPRDAPGPRTLSWQDPTHVVVDRWRTWMEKVDLESGAVQRVDLDGYGKQLNTPALATGLWSRPLREPVEPSGTDDPRTPWLWAALAALGLGVAHRVVGSRRVAARRPDSGASGPS